ncbi:hypothetical protein SLEP1_g51843 [Rubroshorea leprosula]|uniref:Retrotransposon gag domain-containing protein n=1 Tax=Rubroshorea leprosula TaxID=152421 RepID=A0AAV5M751_9ROSI|nr:hypothetical protein SLEP1_g51843 [Rubroshorea leprosula]
MVNTRSVRAGNSSQPLGQGQVPSNLPPHLPPSIQNMFPPVDHAEGGNENQPHNSAHNSASTANLDVVIAQLAAMQQQFGVFQLVLAQLLARNNPGDPLINLLNPAPQPPAPQQNPQLVQHAPALSESQGQFHIALAQQPLPDDVTRRLDSLEKLVAEQRGNARTWYYNLPPRSISFYIEMASAFATKFSSRRLIRKTTFELMRVKQRDGESLKNYMSKFNDAVLEVSSFDQVVGIAAKPTPSRNQNPDWRDENQSRKQMRIAQNRGPMSTSIPRFGRPNSAPPQQSADHGHTTEQCNRLRSKLESLAYKGMLNEYIQIAEQPRFVREQGPQPQGIRVVIPHNDPLVTSVMINNCQVQRVLVDTGSAPDIMYYHCFESLRLDPALLQRYDGPIYGFNNQPVPVEGF